MAVFNRMEEEMMDQEEREALEMTSVELHARAVAGRPAKVARKKPARVRVKQDLNQRAAAIVAGATEELEGISWTGDELASIVITAPRIEPTKPVSFPTNPSVTVK